MIKLHGRSIPMTLEELVSPRYTALIVVDVQNDFCVKEGVYQKHGKYLSKGDTIIKKLKLLIQEARKVGVQIIYIQNTTLPNLMSDSDARLRFQMKVYGLDDPNLIPQVTLDGSWGHKIVKGIKPKNGDLVVKKNRPSAFIGTNLDLLLRSNNIKTLLITGVVTQGCVKATARDGQFHEYFVVIVRDCVESTNKDLHGAALKIMETHFDVVTSDQIIEIWKKTHK